MIDNNFEDITFTIINKDGLEVDCDVINSYYDDEEEKLYVVFTDYTLDENNKFNLYVNELISNGNDYEIKEMENQALKLKLINDTFNTI